MNKPAFQSAEEEVLYLRRRVEELLASGGSTTECSCPSCACGTGHQACECPSPYYPRPQCSNPLRVQARVTAELADRVRSLTRLVVEVAGARHLEEHFGVLEPSRSMSECPDRLCARVAPLMGEGVKRERTSEGRS
jgi:hypothetical protein